MKSKNLFTLLLIICMLISLFAACAKDDGNGGDPKTSRSPSNSVSDNGEPEEITEINIWLPDAFGDSSDMDKVVAAMNEIAEGEIGVHINLTLVAFADWATQVGLALANREPIDIVHSLFTWQPALAANAVMDITDLLDEYGQGVKEILGPEILSGTSINGRVYGLSAYRQLNSNNYFIFRTDILERTGTLEALKNARSWGDFEAILEIIQNDVKDEQMYAIGGNNLETVTASLTMEFGVTGDFKDAINTDALGDSTSSVHTDQEGNVSNRWEREELIAGFKYAADWYKKGYIYPDSAITSDGVETMVRQNIIAGMLQQTEFGAEMQKHQTCGYEMTMVKIGYQYISAAKTQSLGFFIPTSSPEPEAAMKFINLLYTSPELMNLINWGVEGVNYVVKDGIAAFPEGKDISNCGWHGMDYMLGNQFITLPWSGGIGGADFRELALEDMLVSPVSVYIGLVVDVNSVATRVAALLATKEEYIGQVANGMYTDQLYAEFLSKLQAVGVDEYIAFFQAAVDEYMK